MAQTRPFIERLKHGWNAFTNKENEFLLPSIDSATYSYRPDRLRLSPTNEQSIISALYNRLAVDVSSVNILHARLDKNNNFIEEIDSYLNNSLTVEANLDQTGRALILDTVLSMFDEGCVAVVPIDTTFDPRSGSYDIKSLRVAQILEWGPAHIRVRVYNERTAKKEDILVPKNIAAIIENPLHAVMNEPNSTLKRLVLKLNLLDAIDKQSGSGKLDIIIQLPYVIKSAMKKAQADQRRKEMEEQLANSQYGVAYADGTERITQLNRPAVNNLMEQITYLTNLLYSQLGITPSVFDGTADESTMLNYYTRTIDPLLLAITEEMNRKFLTKTARTQKQKIIYQRDPFKLTPITAIAEMSDKFARNEILTANEMRSKMGFRPSDDPESDKLQNRNMPQANENTQIKQPQPLNENKEKGEDHEEKV